MFPSARRGFTLLELLVIVAIIAILIALFLPATRRVRVAAARMQCAHNLKQLALALQDYHSSTGRFPPGCIGPGAAPDDRLSWMVATLPYLEQESLYKQIDREKGYADNLPAARTPLPVFRCLERDVVLNDAVTNYVAIAGLGADAPERPARAPGNGFMGYDRRTTTEMIKDGASNTIALAETRTDVGPWARGGPATVRGFVSADLSHHGERRLWRDTPSGQNVAMADGSVRFLYAGTDPARIATAVTIAGGEPLDL